MVTAESVKGKIQGLIDSANAVTGCTDGNLSTAVGSLIAGFGQGGGSDTDIEDALITKTLVEYENDRVTVLGSRAFSSHINLVSVNLPNVFSIGVRSFEDCGSLKNVNIPKLNLNVSTYAFLGCKSLETVTFPLVREISSYAFRDCSALKKCDFPNLGQIFTNAFMNCEQLDCLILRSNSVTGLSKINAFNNTPFANGGSGGTVYVPGALVDTYKVSTNWSALYESGSCSFAAIEGSEYE